MNFGANIKINAKIGFIGGGNMARALIAGLLKRHCVTPEQITVLDHNRTTCAQLHQAYGIVAYSAPGDYLAQQQVCLFAVKPQQMSEAIQTILPYFKQQLLISVAAGVRISQIAAEFTLHSVQLPFIIRAMPNTPALIGMGISGLFAADEPIDDVSQIPQQKKLAEQILLAVGQIIWLETEDQLDKVTAISGSGPAYFFYFIEALQKAAGQLGLNSQQAEQLSLAVAAGAAQLAVQSDYSVAQLRAQVTSRGGTTEAALAVFSQQKLEDIVAQAVQTAYQRAKTLA